MNRSQHKSVNSVKQKQIVDSTILDQTSDSCIVHDESITAPMPQRASNAHHQIGKVGMSSRVSSKISFNVPKSVVFGKQDDVKRSFNAS